MNKHKFDLDNDSVIREHSTLLVPNSWYTTIGKEYAPKNCDQLAYYILQFYLAKVLFAKNVEKLGEKKNRWKMGKIIAMVVAAFGFGLIGVITTYFASKYLAKKFGTISVEQMLEIVKKLQQEGYIKRNCDGIITIKESKLDAIKDIEI